MAVWLIKVILFNKTVFYVKLVLTNISKSVVLYKLCVVRCNTWQA